MTIRILLYGVGLYAVLAGLVFFNAYTAKAAVVETITTSPLGTLQNIIGGASHQNQGAYPFTPSVDGFILPEAVVTGTIIDSGSPTDGMYVYIVDDASGSPGSTVLATSDTFFPTSTCADHDVTLDTVVPVTAATQYWVVIDRVGANDATNMYSICGQSGGGSSLRWDGSAWSSLGNQWRFVIDIDDSDTPGEVCPFNEDVSADSNACVVYAIAASATDAVPVDNTYQILFNGFILFYMSAFGIIYVFKRK